MMRYLCPKCGNFMGIRLVSITSNYYVYVCPACGLKSKPVQIEDRGYIKLPKELWSDGDTKDEV